MPPAGRTPECPESFLESSRRVGSRYRRCEDHFAVEGELSPGSGLAVVFDLPSEGITVVQGAPGAHPELDPCPVYQLDGAGPPAVPTGRVWIERDLECVDEAALAAVGFRVERVPGFAPEAAWLRASDGSLATALAGLDALAALDGVRLVQPEVLRPRVVRDRPL